MENKFGIRAEVLCEITALAEKYALSRVVLFGSRARGDFHRTSDIDLAVSGGNIVRFSLDVDDTTSTLLQYDIVNLDGEVQQELRDAIDREGVMLYEKI